jgi:membrane associated rhomboid family serine protease
MIPLHCKNPPEKTPWVTYGLLLTNVIVFGLTQQNLVIKNAISQEWGVSNLNLSPLTMFTSMFLHGNLVHLIGNMLFLWIFGCAVEGRLRSGRFALLYLLAGFAGALLHLGLLQAKFTTVPLIGASGAIMGTVAAAMYIFPYAPVCFLSITLYRLSQGEITFEWPMWAAGCYFLAFDLLGAMLSLNGASNGTANLAHIGGALVGLALPMIYRTHRDSEYVSEAKSIMSEAKDYSLLWRQQLEDLALTQPDNPKLAVALMHRAYTENQHAKQEHIELFKRNFRGILRDDEARDLASVSTTMVTKNPDALLPSQFLMLAQRLLELQQVNSARSVLEGLRKLPSLSETDKEATLLQLARIYDRNLHSYTPAYSLYYEFYQSFPMSPSTPAVVARMGEIYPAVQKAASGSASLE